MKLIKNAAAFLAAAMLIAGFAGCSGDSDGSGGGSTSLTEIKLDTFISGVTVDGEERISINNTYIVTPDFIPANASNKNFNITITQVPAEDGTVSTDAVTCVSVDSSDHSVTGKAAGTFRLTVTSEENPAISVFHDFSVKEVPLIGISFDSQSQSIYVGRSAVYAVSFTPSDTSSREVNWSISDETVASIDENGKVTGVAASDYTDNRTATVTVKSVSDESISSSYTLTVNNVLPTAMSLKAATLSAQAGGACTIATTFTPSDTTDKRVTYTTSDSTNFSVSDEGLVTVSSSASDSATITVKSVAKESLSMKATVKVISGSKYIINENDTEKGFVTTNGTIKDYGTGYAGYDGKVIDSLGSSGYVVYSIASATEQNVEVLLHYGFWGTRTELRGAYIVVNGAQDEDIIYCNWTSKNGSNDNIATYDSDGNAATYHSIWEDSNAITVHLDQGENQIRVIPVPAGTSMPEAKYPSSVTISDISGNSDYMKAGGNLPNIDYLQITGTGIGAGSNSLAFYSVKTSGDFGTVTLEPDQEFFKEGTSVKLVPTPNSGYKFDSYSGRTTKGTLIGSADSDYTFSIYDDYTIEAHFIPDSYTADSEMTGYATLTADDAAAKYTISGGAGGNTIEIASLSDLTSNAEKLSGDDPYIVKFISGERICTSDNLSIILSVGSNKTIYGAVSGAGLKNIEMRVQGQNVIIRNLVLGEVIAYDTLAGYQGKGNDALSLNGARHIWVDHCEIRSNTTPKDINGTTVTNSSDSDFAKDWYDGLLDIKNGATWITVSNCYFHDHYKACLCGSGDDGADTNSEGYSDTDMRVTFANNYWKNINARQPLFRWGKAHIYGSYFDAGTFSGGASFINCRAGSELYIEGNTFTGTKSDSYTIGYYYSTTNNSGNWVSKNNSGVSSRNGTSYTPAYGVTNGSAPSSAPTDKGATLTGLSY